jgi:hypothetical protein
VAPVNYPLSNFLSPPLPTGLPSNPSLTAFIPDFYVEGTFIYLTEVEMNQLARADQTYLIKTVKVCEQGGTVWRQYRPRDSHVQSGDAHRVCSRSDLTVLVNDWDNYTNWADPNRAPWTPISTDVAPPCIPQDSSR